MKAYEIASLERRQCYVIGLTWERPQDYLDELAQELAKASFDGTVYFDLLLANGPSKRFFSCRFAEGKFSAAFRLCPPNEREIQSARFFRDRPELLRRGVLTPRQRDRVLEQIGTLTSPA